MWCKLTYVYYNKVLKLQSRTYYLSTISKTKLVLGNRQMDKHTNVASKITWRCGRQVMSSATPRLVTAVRSKQSSCSSCRPRREGSPASVT